MTSAVVGAGVVALGAGMALPDHGDGGLNAVQASTDLIALGNRGAPAGAGAGAELSLNGQRASRGESRGAPTTASTVEQAAPDVWLLPVRTYRVTSLFGPRWNRKHQGVDLSAAEGTPFYSVAAGVVTLCRWNGGFGYNVQIDHGNGVTTVYGHASKLRCKEGQKVRAGDHIGDVGNTGHSFGAHSHFEVHVNGTPVDPIAYMKKRKVDILKHADAIEDRPSSD